MVRAIRVDLLGLLEDGDLLSLVLLLRVLLELGGGERDGDESGQNNELLEKQNNVIVLFYLLKHIVEAVTIAEIFN